MREVDCIVVGQGIAGTMLSYRLLQAGFSVLVVDADHPASATKVASGVINPVTGRRVVDTWKIDRILPVAAEAYASISQWLGILPVCKELNVLSIHASLQMQQAFDKRIREQNKYIQPVEAITSYEKYFNAPYGMHQISPVLLIDLQRLLSSFRSYLKNADLLLDETFDWSCLEASAQKGEPVRYRTGQHKIQAKWILAAEGTGVQRNPFFKDLDFRFNKGEALITSIPDLPGTRIYKQRYTIVPWVEKDLFWIGSTYQWEFDNALPSDQFKQELTHYLNNELKCPFKIIDHIASIRPASVNRRPFSGWHPTYPAIGILNGLGTKGCSLAPYLSGQWADHLLNDTPLDPETKMGSRI